MTQVVHAASAATAGVFEGGVGRQKIIGSDGDDIIYADLVYSDGARHLRLVDGARSAGFGDITAPSAALAAEVGGHLMFFGVDGSLSGGGAAGWEIGADGALDAVWSQSAQFWLEPILTGARAIDSIRHDGATWLVTGGYGLSLSRIDAEGRPQLVDTVWAYGGDGLWLPGAVATRETATGFEILVGGGAEGGLSRYVFDGTALQLEERIEDSYSRRLSDVAAIETVSFGKTAYVLTLSAEDGGLTVWRDGAAGFETVDIRSMADDETGFDLVGATSLVVIEQIGQATVYAATETGKLLGWTLGADGALTRISGLEAMQGATHLTHARVGAADLIFAATASGAVAVYELGARGALIPAGELTLAEGAVIGALAAAGFEDSILLMAARPDQGGFDLIEIAEDGADFVYGGGGDDRIIGGGGHDKLFGQGGADRMFGEFGDDFMLGGGDADLLNGGEGNDELRGGDGDDTLEGDEGDDMLKGGAGRDDISGGDGNDTLRGGMLADTLSGQLGDDLIKCGYGHDLAGGGAGDDTIFGEWGWDELYGGGGDDWIGGGNGDDKIWGQTGDDEMIGALGDDQIWGGAGYDVLKGGGGADKLWGGTEDDFLFGQEGADKLWGENGADVLDGGDGPDTLDGGAGSDTLIGGRGADEFRFEGTWGRDKVMDFQDGTDVLRFMDGPKNFAALIIEQGATGAVVHAGDPLLASITLVGMDADQLSSADFLFG